MIKLLDFIAVAIAVAGLMFLGIIFVYLILDLLIEYGWFKGTGISLFVLSMLWIWIRGSEIR